MMSEPTLKDVVERYRLQLMQVAAVVGVAAGVSKTDPQKHCIQVFVTMNEWPDGVPRKLDGYDVELVKASSFRPL